MNKKQKTIAFRRRRDGQTNYKKRIRLLLGNKPRAVFRKTSKYVCLQLAEYQHVGDKILVLAHSRELKGMGWQGSFNNTPAAYLTGLLFAKKCKEVKVQDVVVDNGLYSTVSKSTFFAILKGMADGGLSVPISEEVMPSQERIRGEHIKAYAEQLQKEGKLKEQFSYDALKVPELFDQVKQKMS